MSDDIDNVTLVETAIALRKVIEAIPDSLPIHKSNVELALPGRSVFYKMLASKISHSYMLEFITTGGESYFGFVIGLDNEFLQIWSPPNVGDKFRHNTNYDEFLEYFDVSPVRHWLSINNIESVSENFFGVKFLSRKSQDDLNNERRAMLRISERYLNPYSGSGK